MLADFSSVTELPGSGATEEQQARLYSRYHVAAGHAAGKRVLEIGCGAGLGLGYLSRSATSVVGGDFTTPLLQMAQGHYQGRIPLVRLDAHSLPFDEAVFDVAIMFEALYYMARGEQVVSEVHRVLVDGGVFLISTVNSDWPEFTPSQFSTRYFGVPDLRDLMSEQDFTELDFHAAFPTATKSLRGRVIAALRTIAARLNLVPKTLGGRKLLKRLFYGKLTPLGPEVEEGMTELAPLVSLTGESRVTDYKIVYAAGRAQKSATSPLGGRT